MDVDLKTRRVGRNLMAFASEENVPQFREFMFDGGLQGGGELTDAQMRKAWRDGLASALAKRARLAGIDEALRVNIHIQIVTGWAGKLDILERYWLVEGTSWLGLCPVWVGGEEGPVVIPRHVPGWWLEVFGYGLDGARALVWSFFSDELPPGWMFWRGRPCAPRLLDVPEN